MVPFNVWVLVQICSNKPYFHHCFCNCSKHHSPWWWIGHMYNWWHSNVNKCNVIHFSCGFHWLSCLKYKHRTCTSYGLVLVYSILVVTIVNQIQLQTKCGWDGSWRIWIVVGIFCISLPSMNHIEFLIFKLYIVPLWLVYTIPLGLCGFSTFNLFYIFVITWSTRPCLINSSTKG